MTMACHYCKSEDFYFNIDQDNGGTYWKCNACGGTFNNPIFINLDNKYSEDSESDEENSYNYDDEQNEYTSESVDEYVDDDYDDNSSNNYNESTSEYLGPDDYSSGYDDLYDEGFGPYY